MRTRGEELLDRVEQAIKMESNYYAAERPEVEVLGGTQNSLDLKVEGEEFSLVLIAGLKRSMGVAKPRRAR